MKLSEDFAPGLIATAAATKMALNACLFGYNSTKNFLTLSSPRSNSALDVA
jgi:hypothetical protein